MAKTRAFPVFTSVLFCCRPNKKLCISLCQNLVNKLVRKDEDKSSVVFAHKEIEMLYCISRLLIIYRVFSL